MLAVWTFLKSGIGRALAVLAAIAAALGYAFLRGHQKGAQAQATKDDATVRGAQQQAASATTQRDVSQAARDAADAVPAPKAPDAVKRDDFNNTF